MTFDQALRLAGLHPHIIVPDGKIRRCKSDLQPKHRNGWYFLRPDGRRRDVEVEPGAVGQLVALLPRARSHSPP